MSDLTDIHSTHPLFRKLRNGLLKCDGPIPWVEVCHCGRILISSVTRHLLVVATDFNQCKFFEILEEANNS